MNRYFLRLSYKGTNYCGWQIQKEDPSVQQALESALTTLGASKIDVTGCGRTDTGVHALDYFAHFDWSTEIQDSNKFIHQLNGILPDDICIHEGFSVDIEAHARFDAISRTYRY
ncbi:MAG: tRNA pseudouridine synthase A, partial [Bacteroidia bacterium]|nr:tRNA pseudouridine synthase A [Bacteroidia bacterium]